MSDGSYLIISTMGFTLSAIGVAYSNWLVNGENNIPSGEDMVQKNEVVAPAIVAFAQAVFACMVLTAIFQGIGVMFHIVFFITRNIQSLGVSAVNQAIGGILGFATSISYTYVVAQFPGRNQDLEQCYGFMCLLGSICLIYAARTNIILLFAARAESEELYDSI